MIELKNLRKKSGLTQADLAGKLGYACPQFVSNWERGICQLPISKFKKVAKIFHVPVAALIDAKLQTDKMRLYKRLGVKRGEWL